MEAKKLRHFARAESTLLRSRTACACLPSRLPARLRQGTPPGNPAVSAGCDEEILLPTMWRAGAIRLRAHFSHGPAAGGSEDHEARPRTDPPNPGPETRTPQLPPPANTQPED